MTERTPATFVAECFWAGVTADDVRALDRRCAACADRFSRDGDRVRYLGSILMRADEVVLCLFEGSAAAVERTARAAAVPFERIVDSANSVGCIGQALEASTPPSVSGQKEQP